MKSGTLILYFTVFFVSNVFPQAETHRFNYPLNIGDFWEYRRSPGFRQTRKVVGDTLMPNGKLYRVIEETAPEGTSTFFQRVSDSTEVFQLEQFDPDEFLLFKLDIRVGDIWTFPLFGSTADSAFSKVFEIADTTIFSKKFKFASIESFTLPDSAPLRFGTTFLLVDSLGIFLQGFEGGKLELQGAIINNKQFGTITSVPRVERDPSESELSFLNSYPNPFNSSTTVEYRLNRSAHVRISVFNVLGERVRLLTDGFQLAGSYRINWSGESDSGMLVSSGIYIYAIEINNTIIAKKAILFLK